jgi:hypothetical protein
MVDGKAAVVTQLFGLFDDFDTAFPIVEPRRWIARTADNRLNAVVALAVLLVFNDCGFQL